MKLDPTNEAFSRNKLYAIKLRDNRTRYYTHKGKSIKYYTSSGKPVYIWTLTDSSDEFCNDGRCERTKRGEKHRIHDISEYDDRQRESCKNLIQLGSQLTGGLIAASLLTAASPEAILGQIVGALLGHSLNIGRFLAPREKTRIGAAFIYATRKAQERLNNNHKIRDDNFFSEQSAERSAAEEIIEGVLLAALYTDNKAKYRSSNRKERF